MDVFSVYSPDPAGFPELFMIFCLIGLIIYAWHEADD